MTRSKSLGLTVILFGLIFGFLVDATWLQTTSGVICASGVGLVLN